MLWNINYCHQKLAVIIWYFRKKILHRKTIIFMINFKNMLPIFDLIHIFTLSAFLIDPSYRTECESYYCWVIWIRGVWRTIVSGLVAVLYSDFRTKNGAHTTLTMIPNSRKQVPCMFLLVLEIIWDWDQKCWPIPLTFICRPTYWKTIFFYHIWRVNFHM